MKMKQVFVILSINAAFVSCSAPNFKTQATSGADQNAKGANSQDGSAQNGSSQNGSAQNGSAQNGSAQNGSAQNGSAQNGAGNGSTSLPGGGVTQDNTSGSQKATVALTNCATSTTNQTSMPPRDFCTATNQVLVEVNDLSSTHVPTGTLVPPVPIWKVVYGCCEIVTSNNASVQSKYETPASSAGVVSANGIPALSRDGKCPENSFIGFRNEVSGSFFVCKSFSANSKSIFYKRIGSQAINYQTTDAHCPGQSAMVSIGNGIQPSYAPFRGGMRECYELDIEQ